MQQLESLVSQHLATQTSNAEHVVPQSRLSDDARSDVAAPKPSDNLPSLSAEGVTAAQGSVGTLHTSEAGDIRYLGKSHWSSMLDRLHNGPALSSLTTSPALGPGTTFNFPFNNEKVSPIQELLARIPPKQHCDYLVSRYFRVSSPLYHILHEPTFDTVYLSFNSDPHSISLSWLALLFAVMALGVMTLNEDDWILRDMGRGGTPAAGIRSLTEQLQESAMKCLSGDNFMVNHRLNTLQTLVLLIYSINHSKGAAQTWTLLGITTNIAFALGCHVDGKSLTNDLVEVEQRRRCWAGLMMLHTIQSTTFGNPDLLSLSNYDVSLPLDLNDSDISTTTILQCSSQPSEMSYVLLKFRLYHLTSKICEQVFGPSQPSRSIIMSLDHEIGKKYREVQTKFQTDCNSGRLQNHHVVQRHILEMYTHQLYLLLHRPFCDRGNDELGRFFSRDKCLASARVLVEHHRSFFDDPTFEDFRWFGLGIASFLAFHGAVALAACLMQQGHDRPVDSSELVGFIDEITARFKFVAERSAICSQSWPILQYLRSLLPSNRPNRDPATASSDGGEILPHAPTRATIDNLLGPPLDASRWVSPATIDWAEWDKVMQQNPGDFLELV